MLRSIRVELLIRDPIVVSIDSTINSIGSKKKVGKAKSQANFRIKLANSKLLVKPNSGVDFLTPKARSAFAKLR